MSVYTTIEQDELRTFLLRYDVGELVSYQGISAGIENTNYFVTTCQDGQQNEFVLTIFEAHDADEMPYFLDLMAHLNEHKVPSAHPIIDRQGRMLQNLKNKPAALVQRLKGSSITETTAEHCCKLGAALGDLHSAGLSFDQQQENTRGPHWWHETTNLLENKLSSDDLAVLHEEMKFQETQSHADIPRGLIHADLFRDNALWHDNELSGIIDLYFASTDALLYDVAVTVNDWCSNPDGSLNFEKTSSLLKAYHQHRSFTETEKSLWPVMLRAAALRFWLSRLYAIHFPKEGEMTHQKDPQEFKTILLHRRNESSKILDNWVP
ncbi:MAG: homoserine kinase [Gammaproteobacteria bacterium]|nr:homoserine kinase [Gammaproteobacteria bacterium]